MKEVKHINHTDAFGTIRTVCAGFKVYFCANDIAYALGFKNPGSAVRRHCLMPVYFSHSSLPDRSKTRTMNFINADDVLRLAAHSLKDEPYTEEFVDSLFYDLMPSLCAEVQKIQEGKAPEPDASEHGDFMDEAMAILEQLIGAVREQFGDDIVVDAIIFPD